jgi:hypothetical protein
MPAGVHANQAHFSSLGCILSNSFTIQEYDEGSEAACSHLLVVAAEHLEVEDDIAGVTASRQRRHEYRSQCCDHVHLHGCRKFLQVYGCLESVGRVVWSSACADTQQKHMKLKIGDKKASEKLQHV